MNISISMNIVLSLDCKKTWKMVGDEITIAMTKLYKHRLGSDWTVCYHLKEAARDEI